MSDTTNILGLFNGLKKAMESAQPNTGNKIPRPVGGVHPCYLIGLDIEPATIKRKPDNLEVPAVKVVFRWKLVTDPNAEQGAEMEFPGAPFILAVDPSTIIDKGDDGKKGQDAQQRIARDRLAGHILVIRRQPVSDTGADLMAIAEDIKTTKIVCNVDCRYRENPKNKDNPYFEEFVQSRIA
jgi:hypothetical protein